MILEQICYFIRTCIYRNLIKVELNKCIYNKGTNKKKKTGESSKWEVPFSFIKVIFMITTHEIPQLLHILISHFFVSPRLRLFEGHLVLIHWCPGSHICKRFWTAKVNKKPEEGFAFRKLPPSFCGPGSSKSITNI